MMFKRLAAPLTAVVIATTATAYIAGAAALPLPGPATPNNPEATAPVELAHGCHPGIQRDYAGWHFHTRACAKRQASPPGLRDAPAYRRYYRGPICSYQCRHVGPVKTCQQVCR